MSFQNGIAAEPPTKRAKVEAKEAIGTKDIHSKKSQFTWPHTDEESKVLSSLGLRVPDILLPKAGTDLRKWAVIACDQFTAKPSYWSKIEKEVGQAPSALRLIFPEVYLDNNDGEERIAAINNTMEQYLDNGIFEQHKDCFILCDRKTPVVNSRKGLIVALDLEKYDFSQGSKSLIRATEDTIVARLPPRIAIRKNAGIELPHIMVLIDDPDKTVIEPLFEQKNEQLYDIDLMDNSGSIKGYKVDGQGIQHVTDTLTALADQKRFEARYQARGPPLLFAMGDGNHSLATAKVIWEELKTSLDIDSQEYLNHKARYVLVELVNAHDEGLHFEPIHRVMFQVDPKDIVQGFIDTLTKAGCEVTVDEGPEVSLDKVKAELKVVNEKTQKFGFVSETGFGIISSKKVNAKTRNNIETGTLQHYLDAYIEEHPGSLIDYVHTPEIVAKLGHQPRQTGFYLPAMKKDDLFNTVVHDGTLPRKTFSMGVAKGKRFYIESRKIR